MKKICALILSLVFVFGMVITPALAGGDKVQHEHGASTAPGPGDDAQGNQVGGD